MSGNDKDFDLDYSEISPEDDNFSQEELDMMYESFDMVNDLKSQISQLQQTKNELAQGVSNIEKKVSSYENKVPYDPSCEKDLEFVAEDDFEEPQIKQKVSMPIKQECFIPEPPEPPEPPIREEVLERSPDKQMQIDTNFSSTNQHISNIKDEIIREFGPIVKNLDMNNLKSNVLDEFREIIDIEFNKLKSELDLDNTRSKRETTKKISDLESKIVEVIKGGALSSSSLPSSISDEEIEEKVRDCLKKYLEELEDFGRVKTDLEEKQRIVRDELDELKHNLGEFIDDYTANLSVKEDTFSGTKFLGEDEKEEFKEYIINKVNNELTKLDDKIRDTANDLKNKYSTINIKNANAPEEELVGKVNEIIDGFNDFKEENKFKLDELKLKVVKEVKGSVVDLIEDTKSKISKQILSNNEFLTKINKKNKELKDNLNESIENKFLVAKKQYEDLFNKKLNEHEKAFESHIRKFEKEQESALKNFDTFRDKIDSLKKDYQERLSEEKNFLKDFEKDFEKEKQDAHAQFTRLKTDMEVLVDEYQQKVNLEKGNLSNLKTEFEKDKKEFMVDIESNLNSKKLEINNEFDTFKSEFRETFNDKIHILANYDEKYHTLIEEKYEGLVAHNNSKLVELEKKFVEKDFEYVKDKIDENLKKFTLYEERLSSKEDEVLNKIEYLNEFEQNFFVEMGAESNKLKEKVELRLTSLEKNLNKRFLDYQSDFDSLKGTIIDEVEDLIKKVNVVLGKKITEVDKLVDNIKLLDKSDVDKQIAALKKQILLKDTEVDNLKKSIKDLGIKLEISSTMGVSQPSMNDYVSYMGSYERQLLSLIDAFKAKGYDNLAIKSALIKKGHPRFYVAVLIEALEAEVLN